MLRNKLVRSDGTVIGSSVIISCEYSEEVNSSTNLSVGDVTASELAVELLATESVSQDEIFTYYMVEDGVETQIGVFKAEKPTIASRTSIKFSAYDNVVRTEKLFSEWLRGNQGLFPMTLLDLTRYACDYCGVTLATTDFPHASMTVNAFYDDGITCRQIIGWAAAIAGRFVRANAVGDIEFAWYEDATHIVCNPSAYGETSSISVTHDGDGNVFINGEGMTVTDDGKGNVTVNAPGVAAVFSAGNVSLVEEVVVPYFQAGLTYENYTVDAITRVQLNHSESDVGTIFPADATGNCLTITSNVILGACAAEDVSSVAASLYNQLCGIAYVPMKIRIPRTCRVRAGSIIRVRSPFGDIFETYVMRMTLAADGTSLESTGDKSYGTDVAVAYANHTNVTGKVLDVRQSVSGLEVKNADLANSVSEVKLTTDEIKTSVSSVGSRVDGVEYTMSTKFEQTSEDIKLQFTTLQGNIDAVNEDLQKKYEERTKYIRFVDGDIILGENGNSLTLTVENDRVSFKQDNKEVAYFAYNKLFVVDGEFIASLKIGKFAYTVSANGNVSWKKVDS